MTRKAPEGRDGHLVSLEDDPTAREPVSAAVPPRRSPTTWVETDLGDSDFRIIEDPKGEFVMQLNDAQMILNATQLEGIVAQVANLGRAKAWI
jgi:hypothetical protein